jgi:peptide chain release factor 3
VRRFIQYEGYQYRLEHEYGAKCTYEISKNKACWVKPDDAKMKSLKIQTHQTEFLKRQI